MDLVTKIRSLFDYRRTASFTAATEIRAKGDHKQELISGKSWQLLSRIAQKINVRFKMHYGKAQYS